jgi:hypothetical protein
LKASTKEERKGILSGSLLQISCQANISVGQKEVRINYISIAIFGKKNEICKKKNSELSHETRLMMIPIVSVK